VIIYPYHFARIHIFIQNRLFSTSLNFICKLSRPVAGAKKWIKWIGSWEMGWCYFPLTSLYLLGGHLNVALVSKRWLELTRVAHDAIIWYRKHSQDKLYSTTLRVAVCRREWSGERVAEWQGRYYTHKLQIVESAIFSPGSLQMGQLNNRAAPQVRVGLIFHPRGW
jgi:hypothetical protein